MKAKVAIITANTMTTLTEDNRSRSEERFEPGTGHRILCRAGSYSRGKPSPRVAITLRWISLVPPSMVFATERSSP